MNGDDLPGMTYFDVELDVCNFTILVLYAGAGGCLVPLSGQVQGRTQSDTSMMKTAFAISSINRVVSQFECFMFFKKCFVVESCDLLCMAMSDVQSQNQSKLLNRQI